MTEDISANLRLAGTINLLAALTAAVLNLAVIGLQWEYTFATNFIMAVNNTGTTELYDIANSKWVTGALAYKMMDMHNGMFNTISIKLADGTTTGDWDVLLDKAHKNFVMDLQEDANGLYTVVLEEVD